MRLFKKNKMGFYFYGEGNSVYLKKKKKNAFIFKKKLMGIHF